MREPSTIDIRISNALANIDKTQKTIARHEKRRDKIAKSLKSKGIDVSDPKLVKWDENGRATDAYWDLCDYESACDDIERNEKKLLELNEKLKGYREKKKEIDAKNDIPHIPALEEFLAFWKLEAAEYYRKSAISLEEFIRKHNESVRAIEAKYEPQIFLHRKEIEAEKKAAGLDYKSYKMRLRFNYSSDVILLYGEGKPGTASFEAKLEKMLSNEVSAKRIDLYHRCTAAVGVITDATGLYVGENGSLNGYIVGEAGKASIETIRAGGYNIQCLHYRVLVKKVREKESLDEKIENAKTKAKPIKSHIDREQDR